MQSVKTHARTAGLLYLALALIAPFSLTYVPGLVCRGAGEPDREASGI